MKRSAIPSLLITSLLAIPLARSASSEEKSEQGPRLRTKPFTLVVMKDQFKGAPHWEVNAVLQAAAGELVQYFPDFELPPVKVGRGAPRIYWRHGMHEGKPYDLILISAAARDWCQYLYQLSHELCHKLQRADVKGAHEAAWFGETLSELASMFVVRAASGSWKKRPPYGNAQYYAGALANYADTITRRYRLPEGITLARHYRENKGELLRTSCNREINGCVAAALLPLFIEAPHRWESIQWLFIRREEIPTGRTLTFEQVLAEWKYHVPGRHKAFTEKLSAQFGIDIRGSKHLAAPNRREVSK